jgi:hypothetical protein
MSGGGARRYMAIVYRYVNDTSPWVSIYDLKKSFK